MRVKVIRAASMEARQLFLLRPRLRSIAVRFFSFMTKKYRSSTTMAAAASRPTTSSRNAVSLFPSRLSTAWA